MDEWPIHVQDRPRVQGHKEVGKSQPLSELFTPESTRQKKSALHIVSAQKRFV